MAAVAGVLIYVVVPYNDAVEAPDAVIVLGGAGSERARLGIALAEEYDATLVLSSSAAHFGEQLGRRCAQSAICIMPEPENTAGEAVAVRQLMQERQWERVAVATSHFHTARARLLFRQCLGDRVAVVGAVRSEGQSVGTARWLKEVAGVPAAITFRRAC
ncbi:hypothetical protein GCM10011354_13510 [Egicoccus halophilus]|uniref:DUF218 domain-containing protein n=2 Tax=Egicoccus halophilus TaxID=1670830 RepID=A0A8J3ERN2_9ACTN|nr:hypothetical protein GCM10011354_13510 [Egicoccus halophilus]